MNIRIGRLEDAKDIAKNNCLLAKESENIDISYETTLSGVKKIISDSSKGFYLVAIENSIIIGQLMITFEWSDWRNKNIWWIQSVYVNKKNRKKGVFKQMFIYVKDEAKKNNVDTLRLYVYESNINAIKSYKKIGMSLEPYYIFKLILK